MRLLLAVCSLCLLSGCGSLLNSTMPAPQTYVLRLAPQPEAGATPTAGSLRIQRPEAGPGLNTDHIVLLRSGRRYDFYAAALWAAPAPDLMASVLVDQMRGSGLFTAVFDDATPYAPRYNLRCSLTRFEADYNGGGHAPTVQVALDCTLGRFRDRTLLGIFTAEGSAVASEDRLGPVVAAFEAATAAAMKETERHIQEALAA